jgi:sulfur carrier protein
MISITLNGMSEMVESSTSISTFLLERHIHPGHVVVEVNKQIVTKDKFEDVIFREGDRIEILRFVGGG